MRYMVQNANPDGMGFVDVVLKNRKITNLEELRNPSELNIIDKYKLDNMVQAVEMIMEAIACGWKIGLIWDCDCDGNTSGALIHNYLHRRFGKLLNMVDYFHTGKEHGISRDVELDDDLDLLIVVDGGSNDYRQHKELKAKGTTVLVLDHHLCEYESKDAIVVNNQLSENYGNKQLSGVGICFKFCEAIDDYVGDGLDIAQDYLDLVAVGNIGDMMDLQQLETRHYAHIGLQQINNKLLKALVEKQDFSMKGRVNFHTVAFYIVPLINGMIREGTQAEKELMAEAFMDIDREIPYKKNSKTETVMVDLQKDVARQMANAKSRQDNKVKKAYGTIEKQIQEESLEENKVIIVDVTGVVDNRFTGLVANKLLGSYKRPVMLLQKDSRDNNKYGGSGRGFGVDSFKDDFRKSKLHTLAEGHHNAFGIGFLRKDKEKITEYFNNIYENMIFEKEFKVDIQMMAKDLTQSDVIAVGELEDIWGSTLQEPMFLLKGIKIKDSEIMISGTKSKTASFKYKNLSFKKYYCSDITYDKLRDKEHKTFGSKQLWIDAICKFKIANYNGKQYPIIDIIDFESREHFDLVF